MQICVKGMQRNILNGIMLQGKFWTLNAKLKGSDNLKLVIKELKNSNIDYEMPNSLMC